VARATIIRLGRTYTPAALGNETVAIFPLKKGDRIIDLAFRKLILGDGTCTLQFTTDAGSGSGTISTALTSIRTGAVGDVAHANDGASMNQMGGFLATGDGFLQAVYVVGTATIKASVRIGLELIRNSGWI